MVNPIKWPLLFLAIAGVICMIWTGIAIGQRSLFGILASMLALILVMGFGFKKKKKMRENEEL